MLEIKNVDVYGLKKALIRSGYPMQVGDPEDLSLIDNSPLNKEINRGVRLGKVPTGTGHDNFLKGITVMFDVKYPQYWTPQFQRYSFADIISSQSKMHKLTSVKDLSAQCNDHVFPHIIEELQNLIFTYSNVTTFPYNHRLLNGNYALFRDKKDIFNAIISNLPMGYEMWMGITTNYLQLKTIYKQRRHHKLEDWHVFCDWVETLPLFMTLIGADSPKPEA
jgi:hypothetical protein